MSRWRRHLATIAGLMLTPLLFAGECAPVDPIPIPPGGNPPGGNPAPGGGEPFWSIAFDTSNVGALSAVWGTGPNDVFVVGGRTTQAEIFHFDGSVWRSMNVPNVPLLVWVYGFGPDDVYAVGLGGGVVHYNGSQWSVLNSGTTEALWGIWGTSSSDMWIVGGTVGQGDPVLIHFDGATFTPVPVPPNDRAATSLFKIWGIGSKIIAVGENGLIIERIGGQWQQVPSGANADDDFVSLWGTSSDNIVAVGGRANARVATYLGSGWTTFKPPGRPGLNASFMDDPDFAVIGGVGGYVGRFERGAQGPVEESSPTTMDIHAIWGDGAGKYYAVGGVFTPPFSGLAMCRTIGDPGINPVPPVPAANACTGNATCDDNDPCTSDRCVGGQCVNDPIDCDDGDPCTDDSCNGGVCVHTAVDCDDGDPCTIDACGLVALRGDFNQDCAVGLDDVGSFVAVVVGGDVAPGHQTRADMDDNGIPDGRDIPLFIESLIQGIACDADFCIHTPIPGCACQFETDCQVGENCVGGLCEPTAEPDIQAGVGAGTLGCITTGFEPFEENGLLQICEGFQGFTEVWLSIRATGFPPNAAVNLTKSLSYVGEGCTTTLDCTPGLTCVNGLCSPTTETTVEFTMVDIGGGVNQIASYGFAMFYPAAAVDGRDVVLTLTLQDANNPSIQATQAYHLTFFVRTICFGPGDCPAGQTCVDNFCAP